MSAPDDLYQLGQDAGIDGFDNYPTQAPELPDAAIGASAGGEMGRPGVMGGGLTPPDVPSPTAILPPASGSSHSASASYRGSGGLSAQDKKDPELNYDLAKADAMARANAEPMLEAEGTANREAKDATHLLTEATTAKIGAEGHAAALMQHMNDDFAAQEAEINAHASAVSNQAKADYMAALMDFKASRVDPSQLWNSHSGGAQFGMLVTAFVHDFLGARGIHTSAMDTFNKAVDRNIDAQVNAIKTKGEVANGFKNLWEMQRQQSASEVEARARVKGFLLEGAKQHIVAHMAQYDAGLATAQGQAAIAKIDGELAKSYVDIYKHIDQNTTALRQQALAKWEAKMKNAQESWGHSIAERELTLRAEKQKAELNPQAELLGDPTKSGGGYARWVFNDPHDKEGNRQAKLQVGGLKAFDQKMDRMIELGREVDALPNIALGGAMTKKLFLDQHQNELVQLQSDLATQGIIAAHGRWTEGHYNIEKEQYPVNTWADHFKGGVESELYAKKLRKHQEVAANLNEFVTELSKDDPRRKIQINPGYDSMPGQAEGAEARAASNPVTSREEANRKALESKLSGPQGREPIAPQDIGADVAADHKAFIAKYPQYATAMGSKGERAAVASGNYSADEIMPREYERALTRLKENVEKDPGDAESIAAIYAQAHPFLNHTSGAFVADPQMEAQSAYAALMLLDLNLGPGPDDASIPEKIK